MTKAIINNVSYSLISESIPSLIISLIGLLITGQFLEDVITDTQLQNFPIVLQSNCILNFKGNIELLFALYVSSVRLNNQVSLNEYLRYFFDNANLVLLQSIIIGVSIGIIGISKIALSGIFQLDVLTQILTTSIVTCLTSTLLFILLLYLTIELSRFININPDNVILPTVSALSDFLSIRFLIFFAFNLKYLSIFILSFIIFICLLLIPLFVFFTFISKNKIPIQSIEVLVFTYILSTISGYILDEFSLKFIFIASTFPVYSGLAASISLIYLHKCFTSLTSNTNHNRVKSYVTLILTSFIIITFYSTLSLFFEKKQNLFFHVLFIFFFIFQVTVHIEIIEKVIKILQDKDTEIAAVLIPVITALGDILSTGLLVLIGLITKTSQL